MNFPKWHQQTVKSIQPVSEFALYLRVLIFGLAFFGFAYLYTAWHATPNPLNKAVADTSVFLMGLSMLLSSVCYFWDFLDTKIVYRKHLGLIGYAFGIAHIVLSWGAFLRLLKIETWQQGAMWPAFTGVLATIIFTVMALISNRYMATELGGKIWRGILRTGYLAMIFIWFHVVLLKSKYWIQWFQGGMKTLPSMSFMVSVFILVVLLMRMALWWSLRRKRV